MVLSKRSKVAIAVGALVTTVAGGVILYTRKPPSGTATLKTITMAAATPTTILLNESVTFSGIAKDQFGLGIGNINGQLYAGTTPIPGTNFISASDGSFMISSQFTIASIFSIRAASGTVFSNAISVTVNNPPSPELASLSLSASPLSVVAGANVTFTMVARSQSGAVLPGVSGVLGDSVSGIQLPNSGFVTDSLGVASVTLAAGATPGSFGVVAAATGPSGIVVSNTVTITVTASSTLSSLELSASSQTAVVGSSVTFTVVARDQFGSPLPGINGALLSGVQQIPNSTFTTNASGAASVSVALQTAGAFDVFAASATPSGDIVSNTVTITVTAGQPLVTVYVTATDALDPYLRTWAIFVDTPPGAYLGNGVWGGGTPSASESRASGNTMWAYLQLSAGPHTIYFIVSQSGGPIFGTYSGTETINGVSHPFTGVDANTAAAASITV